MKSIYKSKSHYVQPKGIPDNCTKSL